MTFQPIRRILPKAIQDAGIQQQVTAARVLAEAEQVIRRVWGEEKAAYVKAISFADGQLKLRASAPAAVQELTMQESRLLNEINRALGSKTVTRLFATLGG